jgi:hypothetical protein
MLPNGDFHGYLAIPCDEKHPGECEDYSMIEVADTPSAPQYPATIKQTADSPAETVNQVRNILRQRYHVAGQSTAPRD